MMDKHNRFLGPKRIDEQIELFSTPQQEQPQSSEDRLLVEMHRLAAQLRDGQEIPLQRTWLRLQERSKAAAVSFSEQKKGLHMNNAEALSPAGIEQSLRQQGTFSRARVLGTVIAATVMVLIVLTWAVLVPALRQPASVPNTVTGVTKTVQATDAHLLCSYKDDNPGAANFFIDYSLSWSRTNALAFTHRDSVVVNGANCARNTNYKDNLSIPQGAVWSPNGQELLAYSMATSGNITTTSLVVVNRSGQILRSVTVGSGGPVGSISPGGSWLSSRISLGDNRGALWGPAWSPDGSEFSVITLVGSSLDLETWKTQSGQQTLQQPIELSAFIRNVAWSPSGDEVAVATDDATVGTLLLNAHTGALIKHIATQVEPVVNLAWSPNSQYLATSGQDNMVRIWSVASGRQTRTLSGALGGLFNGNVYDLQLAWSPNGTELAAGDVKTLVWNVNSGDLVAHVNNAGQTVAGIAWSPDGSKLATISAAGYPTGNQEVATLSIWRI